LNSPRSWSGTGLEPLWLTVPNLAATGLTSSEIAELQNLLDRATANLDRFNRIDDDAAE
jgi:hypothetical protein